MKSLQQKKSFDLVSVQVYIRNYCPGTLARPEKKKKKKKDEEEIELPTDQPIDNKASIQTT